MKQRWGRAWTATCRAARAVQRRAAAEQRGEGVISTAIAVLIMAFLGVAMWAAFSTTFNKASAKVDNKVTNCVGASSNSPDC